MLQLYFQNSRFRLFLMHLIVGRMLNSWEQAELKARAAMR